MLTIGIDSVTLLEVRRQTIEVVTILHLDQDYTEKALIDSGAGGNFMDIETTKCLHLLWTELRRLITVRNIDGTQNNKEHIMHQTILEMTIANKCQEVSLLITGLGKKRIILGLPWLIKENLDIDWMSGTL